MIEFYPTNAPDSRRAFLEHLRRFARQDRDVSWTSAPEVFASTYGKGAEEAVTNSLRGAMESCFDRGEIRVERLPDGSNKLIAVAPKARAKASCRTTTRKPVARCGAKPKHTSIGRPSGSRLGYVPLRTPLIVPCACDRSIRRRRGAI